MSNRDKNPQNDSSEILNNLPFESAYNQLEEIVDKLESGELTLDETLALYETGRRLILLCENRLDNAELRINKLVSDSSGGLKIEPLS